MRLSWRDLGAPRAEGAAGKTVEIVISDDGPGIAPDMLKRIGEPYLSRRRSGDEAQGSFPSY